MDQKTIGFRLPATSSCSVRRAEPSIEASDRRRANAVTTSIYRTALALRVERGTRSSGVTIRPRASMQTQNGEFHTRTDVWVKLKVEMPRRTGQEEAGGDQRRPPVGLVLKPPVSVEDLKTDTEYDPEGAEEFVALIRALGREDSRPVAL